MNRIDLSSERSAAEPARGAAFCLRTLSRRACAATWPHRTAQALIMLLAILHLATGCKLVELKMPGEPMPKEEFALRGQTREFAKVCSATVQHVANSISSQTNDPAIRTHCLQWKIGAVGTIRAATLRSSPKLAMLDAWAFCRQMDEYFARGAGTNLFGPYQIMAVTNSQALEQRLEHTARILLPRSEFAKMDKFLVEYVAQFPLQTISFDREPVLPLWEKIDGKPPIIPPAGTSSEALSDVADRLQILGEQVPDEIRWRLTLEGDALETEWTRTGMTFDRVDTALKQIGETAAASPAIMTNAILDLKAAFLPELDRFQNQWDNTTRTLQTERQALTQTLATERAAVLKDVAEQRAAFMKESQNILQDLTDRTLKQVRGTIRDVLFYAVLLVGIVLGLPFSFGFVLGRVWDRAKRAKKAPREDVVEKASP